MFDIDRFIFPFLSTPLPRQCKEGLPVHKPDKPSSEGTKAIQNPAITQVYPKETTLERADFTLQLLMFVTAEKERRMFTIFSLSSFCELLSPRIQARTGCVRPDHESSDQPA